MPEFKVEVVKLQGVTKHPNADTLSVVQIFGQTVIFRTGDFAEGDLAAYVPYDAVVPTDRPVFKFLTKGASGTARIKPIRLRGTYSEGVLVPPPQGAKVGQDVAQELGVTKYVEPEDVPKVQSGPAQKTWQMKLKQLVNGLTYRFFGFALFPNRIGDPGYMPKYDLENYLRYKHVLEDKEEVVVTEKLHGSNCRFLYYKRRLWVASHGTYRNQEDNSWWWQVANKFDLKSKLKKIPSIAVYGEVYGPGVQDLTYSARGLDFRVFDMYNVKEKAWLDFDDMAELCDDIGLQTVPVLYRGPYVPETIEPLRSGKSTLDGKTLREGIVIKPRTERSAPHFGRVALKYVSEEYKLRSGRTTEHH